MTPDDLATLVALLRAVGGPMPLENQTYFVELTDSIVDPETFRIQQDVIVNGVNCGPFNGTDMMEKLLEILKKQNEAAK